ncbi:dihydroorotase [Alphaproteobacteria bacterium]|nr:dihydroorotase [Alphaproteobacteria bacterium]
MQLEIIKPDDWHVHFREGEMLRLAMPQTVKNFARAVVMPNLLNPITSIQDVINYKKMIENEIPEYNNFVPLMTVYLTEDINIKEIIEGYKNKIIFGAKLYPAGVTTNSNSGINNISKIIPMLEAMAKIGMPLLIHGETNHPNIDIFDKEKYFIDNVLVDLISEIPDLKITLEHITTKDAVDYVRDSKNRLAASITPHHLALNRNAMFKSGIRPHYFCLPILKRERHRLALLEAATSGDRCFFLGTDSAPHHRKLKENICGCAGIFNSPNAIEIVTQIFENSKSIEKLESFVSVNGSIHYELNINKEKIILKKSDEELFFDNSIKFGREEVAVFQPEFPVYWYIQ